MKQILTTLWWTVKKMMFGFVAFYAFNFVASIVNIRLASNYVSYFLIGALGVPGLLFVYLFNVLFLP